MNRRFRSEPLQALAGTSPSMEVPLAAKERATPGNALAAAGIRTAPLSAIECLCERLVKVSADDVPAATGEGLVYAVFATTAAGGRLLGLATGEDIAARPGRPYGELVGPARLESVSPQASVASMFSRLSAIGGRLLAVLDDAGAFLGAVSLESLSAALLRRERQQQGRMLTLIRTMRRERRHCEGWIARLTGMFKASHELLGILSQASTEATLLQTGIDALMKLIDARYAALALTDQDGRLIRFHYAGITAEEAALIERQPEGRGLLGVVVDENRVLRLDDLSKDPRSRGFPPGHPAMKTLLAVPISHDGRVYGRIYLTEKEGGQPFSDDDETLAKSFAQSIALVIDNNRTLEEVRRARQNFEYLSNFDPLTGLPNRKLFSDRIDQVLGRARRRSLTFALLFIDLDNFKRINDTLGHSWGDRLLKEVSGRINDSLRQEDTVARWGGDEFVVLLPEINDDMAALLVARKILAAVAEPVTLNDEEIYVGASIGVSFYPTDAADSEGLLANADVAMYHAKSSGKNNIQCYASHMNASANRHLRLESHLRAALERKELVLVYQPQVETLSHEIVGMEVLLRWHSQELGPLSPAEFIPLAEATGLIIPIGEWVLREACTQAMTWQSIKPVRVAVNLSVRQFQDEGFLQSVVSALEDSGLPASCLELEITESILMQQIDSIIDVLTTLKNRGVRFAIDDFGTGYSSLSYLKRFPIDVLKIDKSFVRDIATDPNDAAIVSAITAMARELKLDVVAEGVETDAQQALLVGSGCQTLQGFHFSRPVSAAEALSMIRTDDRGAALLQ